MFSSSSFPSDSQTLIPILRTSFLAIKFIKNGKEIHFVLHLIHYRPVFSILYSISYNISFQTMRNLVLKRNIVFFRGKMTVSPNTLNNEIHTYFFAHYWQQQHTKEQFQKHNESLDRAKLLKNNEKQEEEPKKEFQYSFENWMKLIADVAQFNRFYCECYNKRFGGMPGFVPINTMDNKAFRLFHDWDVWGDSTSYPEIKATAYFDATNDDPLRTIDNDLYMTTKIGTNKCVIANQDTDNQDMSKIFALTLNMNDQLKLHINPSVCRDIHFRTVDTLPWTPSSGVHWFANGSIGPLHGDIQPKNIALPFKSLVPSEKPSQGKPWAWAEMRMIQYRYNHPTKVSSLVGYVMNTHENQDGKWSYSSKNWRIVECEINYNNPNPLRSFNGSTNNKTTIEIFMKQVAYGNLTKKQGILVDISAAILDANTKDLFPILPTELNIEIRCGDAVHQKSLTHDQIKQVFHHFAGIILIEDKDKKGLPVGQKITIKFASKIHSGLFDTDIDANFPEVTKEGEQKKDKDEAKNAEEKIFNIEVKDRFMKNKIIKDPIYKGTNTLKGGNIDDKSEVKTIFEEFITFDVYLTSYGQPFTGSKEITLSSQYNISSSGLIQYTTNMDFLQNKVKQPVKPKDRIEYLLKFSEQFAKKYKSYSDIDKDVFQNKLEKVIIPKTNKYIDNLYSKEQNKLRYAFEGTEFKLLFKNGLNKQQVKFQNGYAQIQVALNQRLTEKNNPRNPSMESLCLVGTFAIQDKEQILSKQDFTTIFYQNPCKDPYDAIDWLNVVGQKLKLMGLMYPAMQNIVNLYNYDGLSMSAMKRAFEIEDENHSRYMPATREMSSVTHRQIRRWLYNPLYDDKIYLEGLINKNYSLNDLPFDDFATGKKQLFDLLNEAFKIELTTIPLYLSALFSIKDEGEASKLIRSVAKDEMKHLFIVSNLLNAIGKSPPYPLPNQKQAKYVPNFPVDSKKELICFHFQMQKNKKWADLMGTLPIQSSIREQLLRFIMIEMPAEAYEIDIKPLVISRIDEIKRVSLQNFDSKEQSGDDKDLESKLLETKNRIKDVFQAVQAVALQQRNKIHSKPGKDEFITIGMAYQKIMNYLWKLNDMDQKNQLFDGNNRKQFTYMYLQDMTEIINLRTSLQQIRLIVSEGEGSSLFSVTGDINKSSHFIKFIEIFTGCDLRIQSRYEDVKNLQEDVKKRSAEFIFKPNYVRFPNFPNYSAGVEWNAQTDKDVDNKVNYELQRERLSDNLRLTKFPNTYAPLSFVNAYVKILEEFGFIFNTNPETFKPHNGKTFEEERLERMENAIAKMRQMSLNASHVIRPNDTFDQAGNKYPSASPKYNIEQSSHLPPSADEK